MLWQRCVFVAILGASVAMVWLVQAGNVRDFGAVGDGQADDTAAIREAKFLSARHAACGTLNDENRRWSR